MKSWARKRKQIGRCYELSGMAMINEPGAKDFVLVHGSIVDDLDGGRIGHAWIELYDGLIFDAVQNTYETAERYIERMQAVAEHRYAHLEACRLMSVAGHYGPWTDAERQHTAEVTKDWGK